MSKKNQINKKPKVIGQEINLFEKDSWEDRNEITQKIVLKALYSLRLPQPIIHCSKKIILTELPNYTDKMVGQILGKGGKHKKDFISITGVNLELDKETAECIILSKYNTIDVEKASRLLSKLFKKSSWSTQSINKQYELVKREFKNDCVSEGSKILKEFLKYETPSKNLAEMVGLLKYTYSYNQNILDHSYEVSQLSANVAAQLGLNPLMAKRAGFFHDIGKSISNYEDHVVIGCDIAKKENLDNYIQNTIMSHHGKIKTDNPYAIIVKAMDKISAGRIGARPMQKELIDRRKTNITQELSKLDWIEKVILKNAGNLIQIFIKLTGFVADELPRMKQEVRDILNKLNDQYTYNYQIELKMFYEENMFLKEDVKKEENVCKEKIVEDEQILAEN